MDNATRRDLLYKARAAGYPGSILDVFANYEQGRDLIGEFQQQQQQQQMQQQQMPNQFVQPEIPEAPQIPAVPSSPTPAPNYTPAQPAPPIGIQSEQTQMGIVSNQSGPNQGRAIFATGGFTGDPIKGSTAAPTFGGNKPQFLQQPGPTKENLKKYYGTQNFKTYDPKANPEPGNLSQDQQANSPIGSILEFADPTGVLSYTDANEAYHTWKSSGNAVPTLDQGLSMFSAVPVLGKFGKFKYAAPMIDAMKPVIKTFPWQQALNVWETQSESQPSYEKKLGGAKCYTCVGRKRRV